MKKIITINTDASFCPISGLASYGYWIKGFDFHFKGSGKFKKKMTSSTESEIYGVMVAIYILKSYKKDFDILVINCDNQNIWKRGRKSFFKEFQKQIEEYKNMFKDNKKRKIIYKYVKSHTSGETPREYVNNWCDKEAKKHLKEMRKNNLKFNFRKKGKQK